MEHSVDIYVVKVNKEEDTVEVHIDIDEFNEQMDKDEKIEFIKSQTKKQYKDVKKVHFNKKDLKELQGEIDDICDPSDMIGDEDFDEFMEHENLDD
jgi:hypothetical protein